MSFYHHLLPKLLRSANGVTMTRRTERISNLIRREISDLLQTQINDPRLSSFISVTKVIPSVASLLKADGHLLVLIKPQFEAKREEVGKGGVIKEPQIHATVLGRFITWVVEHGFRLKGLLASPILGSSGNKEFFVLLNLT